MVNEIYYSSISNFCLFGFMIFQIVVCVCFQLMMLTKMTVMVAEIRQVRLRVQSLNRSKLPESYSTYHFQLVTKVDSGVYIVLISCVIYCFGVSATFSR